MALLSSSPLLLLVISTFSLLMSVNSQTTEAGATVSEPYMTETVTEIMTVETPVQSENMTVETPVQTPVVGTSTGMVSGSIMTLFGGTAIVDVYLGIPYAEPPVKDLRFAKPQPRQPWNETFEALEYGSACPQSGGHGDSDVTEEDCLSLNVFVPRVTDSSPLPVMVYIHGGSFTSGSGSFSGEIMAAFGKVIVVNINYRLGVFGFLSTGDDNAKGNWGLWDQRLALQWVKENAVGFGGDPSQITIFGGSAGADSVLYQVMSPENTNELFQRAISQSAIHFNFLRNDVEVAASLTSTLAQNLGFDQSEDSLIDFLRNQPAENLLGEAIDISRSQGGLLNFYPVIDGEFISESGIFEISSQIEQYDIMIGINTGDASAIYFGEPGLNEEAFLAYVNIIVNAFCQDLGNCKGLDLAIQAATFAYNDIQVLQNEAFINLVRLLEMGFEAAFASPTSNLARHHSEGGGNTFVYEFAYEDANRRTQIPTSLVPNPVHGAEGYYVSGSGIMDMVDGNMDHSDLSYAFMTYWTNFAHNGDPNVGNTEYIDVTWPKFDLDTQSYLILKPNATVGENFAAESYAFWYEYIKNLLEEAEEEDPDEGDPDEGDPDEGDPDEEESCELDAEEPIWESLPQPEMEIYDIVGNDNVILGSIAGTRISIPDAVGPSPVHLVRGIPYAKPPLGPLRFTPPKDMELWVGVLNGTLPAPSCPDAKTPDWDEDCLTLDIAAPEKVDDSLLPVIVFINGYNFQSGGKTPSPENLASGTKSVVVTFRYRVGALGFLSTDDKYSQGNFGILDTVAVLKWVKKYISKSFGGDPDNVTLMGYGTGGSIVNLMLFSSLTKDLFHRAISLGGTASSKILHPRKPLDPLKQAISLGQKVECWYGKDDTKGLMKCLRHENTTVSDILYATESFSTLLPFFPVVDDYFLTDSIQNLILNDSFPNVKYDYLIGFTEDQEAVRLMGMMEESDTCPTEDEFREHVSSLVDMYFTDPGPVREIIAIEYLENLPSPSDEKPCPILVRLVEFLNDFFTVIPTLEAATAHTKAGGRVYVYSFQHTPKYRTNHTADLPSWIGPAFWDDLQYLFAVPGGYEQEDWQTTRVLHKILQDFIKTGDPSGLEDVDWSAFDPETRQYLEVDACPSVSETGLGSPRLRFWTEIIPLLQTPPPIDPKEKCIVGEELGLSLSPLAAARMIEVLIGIAIALVAILLLVCGAACGMRRQIRDNKTSAYELDHDIPGAWNTDDQSAYL